MKPKILITNDDGVHARGIFNLYRAVKDLAEVIVVAPSSQKSATGQASSLTKPLKIHTIGTWEGNPKNVYSVNGTPADCVKLAISVIMNEKPDMIVSGINRGSNAGRNVINSGTVGGVIEGVLRGIPGAAFSCSNFEKKEFDDLELIIRKLVMYFIKHAPAKGSLYNVNLPDNIAANIKGIKMAKQGRGYWIDTPEKRMHPEGVPYYWLGGTWNDHEEEKDSDVALLKENYATVVPIHIDQMTDTKMFNELKSSFETLFTPFTSQKETLALPNEESLNNELS